MPKRLIKDVLPLGELNKTAQKGGGIGSLNAMHPLLFLGAPPACLIPLPGAAESEPERGTVSAMEMANVMKTAMNLSKLSAESSIMLDLQLELKGEVNGHSVQMALREIGKRVAGLAVEDVK